MFVNNATEARVPRNKVLSRPSRIIIIVADLSLHSAIFAIVQIGRALEATREELKVSSVHSGKAGEFFGYFASGAEVRELPRCKLVGSTGQIGLSESMAIALPKAFGIRTPIVCPHHDDVQ